MSADSFTVLTGVAAPLMRANIDTDTVIRIERLTNAAPEETGRWLFEALRMDAAGREKPDFVLNQPHFQDAPILLAGENFGCGSSGEADQVERLARECAGGNARITVDLERRVVVTPRGETLPFHVEAIRRDALLAGLDEIGLTMTLELAIDAFQSQDRVTRPWVWRPGADEDSQPA
jgi:3-isopropylmalate/(R)-2-methylmalate dehydratase small subunit